VTWFISLFYKSLYVEALVNEVTTFAAFTALLVFLASVAGVSIGRFMVDRNLEKQPRQHHGLAEAAADQDRADTDVFAAVSQPASTDTTETAPTEARREERREEQS
jgi:hypothetical protein